MELTPKQQRALSHGSKWYCEALGCEWHGGERGSFSCMVGEQTEVIPCCPECKSEDVFEVADINPDVESSQLSRPRARTTHRSTPAPKVADAAARAIGRHTVRELAYATLKGWLGKKK